MVQARARNSSDSMRDVLLFSMQDDIAASWTWVGPEREGGGGQHGSSHAAPGHERVKVALQGGAAQDGTCAKVDGMLQLLFKVGCRSGAAEPERKVFPAAMPTLVSLVDSGELPDLNREERVQFDLEHSLKLTQITDHCLSEMLEDSINKKLENGLDVMADDALVMLLQQKELGDYRQTAPRPRPHLKGGSRILCLDGGGMKGLAQIEVLSQLEEATGRKITELFDWIVGTSTGAIIALAMVYGELFNRCTT